VHDETRNECIKCMYICGLRNDIRMAVESIVGNTLTLETALTAAVQYESALVTGSGSSGQKQGGAQRYGVAAARSRERRMLQRQHLSRRILQECTK
jgi:hypothetical protein